MTLTLSEKIKILIKRRNITISEVARRTGQTRQNLSNKIKRDNFTIKELCEIAKALDCEFVFNFKLDDEEV